MGYNSLKSFSIFLSAHCIAYEYQNLLLYLIAELSYWIITFGTLELVLHSTDGNRSIIWRRPSSPSISAHHVLCTYNISLLCSYAEQSYCTKGRFKRRAVPCQNWKYVVRHWNDTWNALVLYSRAEVAPYQANLKCACVMLCSSYNAHAYLWFATARHFVL